MTGRVAVWARAVTAAVAVFAVWQLVWLADQAERVHMVLPTPWTVTSWLVAWAAVLVAAVVATASGIDLAVRITCGLLLVVEGAGILVAIGVDRSIGTQFWAVGQAGLIMAVMAALLVSPLRSIPRIDDLP